MRGKVYSFLVTHTCSHFRGSSPAFHADVTPAIKLLKLYGQFGIKFDHIYAYEEPDFVFEQVPPHLHAAYHWINVGVSKDANSPLNPFNMLLESYNEDDLIIVKLDVDTPDLERDLAEQLRVNPAIHKLVDHFYFEHHVNQEELAGPWGGTKTKETVQQSMELFRSLRENGVAAHYWV